jgi:competence protein ComEC
MKPGSMALGGGSIFCLGLLLGSWSPEPTRITFLSVGQGDCAVIQAGGRTVLVDVGPTSPHFDTGQRLVLPKLRDLGVEQVDLILLSHPDLDHVGGTPAILRRYPSAKIAMSAQFREDREMLAHLCSWRLSPDRVSWLGPESTGRLGPLTLRLSCPPKGLEANDGSMFVRVGTGAGEVVLTGDAPERVELLEGAKGDWSAEVLKAGHHGSRTSSSYPWLREVHPKWVVVSCGRENPYGHPHPAALRRIESTGAQLARTDREGDITFEWRGEHLVRVP